MADAFYLPTADDSFLATEHTEGPWTPGAQHGGPPAALLGRAIERTPGLAGAMVSRVTCEILGPVPVGDLTIRTRLVRSGRSVELVEAELEAGGRTAMRAAAWRIRTGEFAVPEIVADDAQPPLPRGEVADDPRWRSGYLDAIEWQF